MDAKCPGQSTRFWKAEDIFETPCPGCGAILEFFKVEPTRICYKCKQEVANPRVDFGCALWCDKAIDCIGPERYKQITESAPKGAAGDKHRTKKEMLLHSLDAYFGEDARRIAHARAVLGYAELLLEHEKADRLVVIAAAVLHDIGIRAAEEKYKSSAGNYQEIEGPPIARAIMEKLQFKKDVIDEVCLIIANHHSPGKVNTLNFKVLYDSDWLVNMAVECDLHDKDKLAKTIDKVFLTQTGRDLAKATYLETAQTAVA